MKVNLNEAFPWPAKTGSPFSRRTYDIKISLIENSGGPMRVRFGVLNKAAEISKDFPYVEVSSPLYSNDHIFFRFYSERQHKKTYKLIRNSGEKGTAKAFSFTPSKEESKAWRKHWAGKTYSLLFDEESGLYYVTNLASTDPIDFDFLN